MRRRLRDHKAVPTVAQRRELACRGLIVVVVEIYSHHARFLSAAHKRRLLDLNHVESRQKRRVIGVRSRRRVVGDHHNPSLAAVQIAVGVPRSARILLRVRSVRLAQRDKLVPLNSLHRDVVVADDRLVLVPVERAVVVAWSQVVLVLVEGLSEPRALAAVALAPDPQVSLLAARDVAHTVESERDRERDLLEPRLMHRLLIRLVVASLFFEVERVVQLELIRCQRRLVFLVEVHEHSRPMLSAVLDDLPVGMVVLVVEDVHVAVVLLVAPSDDGVEMDAAVVVRLLSHLDERWVKLVLDPLEQLLFGEHWLAHYVLLYLRVGEENLLGLEAVAATARHAVH